MEKYTTLFYSEISVCIVIFEQLMPLPNAISRTCMILNTESTKLKKNCLPYFLVGQVSLKASCQTFNPLSPQLSSINLLICVNTSPLHSR